MSQPPASWRLVRADPDPPFEITVDDRPVPAVPGQTIGAALWAAGVRSTRQTRGAGRPRGLFCGIGICFDCLVTVNDRPALRACQIEARPGDVVRTGTM
ncbi:(2Fe-2S)-binding protein [Dactylosporangium sucinum]|uniref:Proline dehydrogenase n=1 Tax=Dactylosporangium sucinum TaxID=1424081 RepID=A0A917WHY1_9ACTN|nr:(2Fe-2S)-binding protein [Dactylosporangium sucinum]GGM04590.1 proline dehydrogenase [Dactylosporangium sucinum]